MIPQRSSPHIGRVRLVYITCTLWVIGFIAYTAQIGLPTKRSNVVLWLLLAIAALGFEKPRWTIKTFFFDWGPIIVALASYDILRGMSENGRTAHHWPHMNFDQWIGGGDPPSVHLQNWFHVAGQVRWYDFVAWGVYTSHFLFPLGLGVVLWAVQSPRFRPYIWGLALLSYMGLATYYLYPAKPPWMTGQEGLTPHVERIVHDVWGQVGIEKAQRVWSTDDGASRYSNTVAALPSLHAAFPMFAMLMLLGIRKWLTVVYCIYVVAMGVTLVYAGEHFVFDLLMGWVYAIAAAAIISIGFHLVRSRKGTLDAPPATPG